MRILLRILLHRRILRRLILSLPLSSSIKIKLLLTDPLPIHHDPELPRKGRQITRLPQRHRVSLFPKLCAEIPMEEITSRFILVAPRENIRPTPHAYRSRHIVPIKDHPIGPQPIHLGRPHILIPVAAYRVGALIIRK